MRTGIALAVVAAVLSISGLAAADDTTDCIAASEQAQKLRAEHKLLASRERFAACARSVCPGIVQKDCVDQLAEVNKLLPSVVLSARDGAGNDLVDVRVSIDDKLAVTTLDGKPVPLDPGVHRFHFEVPGQPPADKQVVIAESEQARAILVTIAPAAPKPPPPPPKPVVTVPPPVVVPRRPPVAGFAIGGAGVAALVVAPVLWSLGLSQKSTDESGCAKTARGCSDAEVGSIHTKLVAGDVVGGVGLAALVVGGVLVIRHYASGSPAPQARSAFGLDVQVLPSGAGATLGGRF